MKTSSSILDEILESQRSPFDKTGLGYGKTKKETEEGPSCSIFDSFVPTQNKEEVRSEVKNKPYVAPRPTYSEENQPPNMFREIGMMVFFMAIAFHAMDMVIEL